MSADEDRRPEGYVEPSTVWLVEYIDPRDPTGGSSQVGGFTSKLEAKRCQRLLRERSFFAETHINTVPIHSRVEDWMWDE